MEFLEGFEEDDNPQVMKTSSGSTSAAALDPTSNDGLKSSLNTDEHSTGSGSLEDGRKAASSATQQQQQQQHGTSTSDLGRSNATTQYLDSSDDDIAITGFSDGRGSASGPSNGHYSQQGQYMNTLNPAYSSTPSSVDPSGLFLPRSSTSDSHSKPSIASSTSTTSSATPTATAIVRPSSSLSQYSPYGSFGDASSAMNGAGTSNNLGRIPIITGTSSSTSSNPRPSGTPYGATFSPGIAGSAGTYGSSFPFATPNYMQGYSLPQASSSSSSHHPRQPYSQNQGYNLPSSNYNAFQHPLASSFGNSAFNPLRNTNNGYNTPVASTSTHSANHYRALDSKSRTSSGSAIIDLTEQDDNDTGSASNNEYGTGANGSTSVNSGGSDDEIKISSEKLHLKAPEDEEDDELELVGERPNEATNPVCIGQLSGVALILYPIPELCPPKDQSGTPSNAASSLAAPPPLTVALLRTTPNMPSANGNETIKLYSAQTSENFGVVEHRIANVLGPIMTRDNKRGMGVWVEAKVIRTRERSVSLSRLSLALA